MKIKNRLAALLVTSASLLAASTVSAATYVAGDLLLGFRATGGTGLTTDYIINLGSSTSIRDAAPGTTLGSYATDLTATYGANWATRTDLYWGLITIRQASGFGANVVNGDPKGTLYASFDDTITKAVIDAGATVYLGMAGQFAGLAASGNAANASFSLSSDAIPQIWSTQMNGAGSFNSNLPEVEHALSSGNTIDVNRFLAITNGDTFGGSVGVPNLVATLSIDSATGQISIIPEPSSFALVGLGLVGFITRRRRVA